MSAVGLLLLLVSLLTPSSRGIVYRTITGTQQLDMEDVLARLEEEQTPVMVGLIINNHSGHKLKLEEVDHSCGVVSANSSMPDTLLPDTTAVVFIEKVNIRQLTYLEIYLVILIMLNCNLL